MKLFILANKGWCVAALIVVFPLILVLLIEPKWLARMIGFGLEVTLVPISVLLFGILHTQSYFVESSLVYRWLGKKKADAIARSLLILLAGFAIYTLTMPLVRDIAAAIKGEAPVSRTAYVASTRVNSISGLILEHVILDKDIETKENSFFALFFAPRHIMHERTYEFLYLPNSRIILDAKLTTSP